MLTKQQEKELRRKRRNEKEKKKKKAREIYPNDPRAEHLADNLAVCSCDMCKNPRRSKMVKGKEKLTIQERKLIDQGNWSKGF